MKQIKRKDLKIGDIFVAGINFNFINKEGTKFSLHQIKRTGYTTFHNGSSGSFSYDNLRKATPEEKHWLNTCIEADKFISYEEAMKSFIPEYVVLEEPKDKVLEKEGIDLNIGKIIRVKSSEGAIFELGDKVTVFNKTSPNKGKVFTIKGFRWNNAKTNICAITELHKLNGIGVDKLEIYIESKVKENLTLPKKECIQIPLIKEESLLDKAKRLYPIGTKFKNAYRGKFDKDVIFEIDGNNIYNPQFKKIGIHYGNNWLVFNDQWAEVIEYPHGFKVGDKISHKNYSTNWEIEKIEGNVLFLKDQPLFYNTILAKNAIKVDDFVLPEKWCVKNTDPLIYRFFDSKLKYMSQCYNNPIHENNYLHSIDLRRNNVINSQIEASIAYNYVKPDYTEITFEQFKKYVLNETV